MSSAREEGLADRLDAIAEELTELAIESLKEAIADRWGPHTRPEAEKRLTQARRAVEKAAHLLRRADGRGEDLLD